MNIADLKIVKAELQADALQILCDGAIEVNWRELLDLQILDDGRSLKDTDDDKILRLAESLLRFGIVNNLQVWFNEDGDCYCFDAHHRRKAFEVLDAIGLEIPPLPATRCLASSKIRAMQLLLVKESKSSWVNYKVVPDYLQQTGFSFKVAARVIDIPGIKWNEICEPGKDPEKEKDRADEIPEPPPVIHIKTGDLIELGTHRLLCGDSTQSEDVARLMGVVKADMVFTDPPYGIGEAAGKNKSRGTRGIPATDYGNKDWDNSIPPKIAFDLMFQYSVNQMIFGGNYFVEYLNNSPCWLVWDKDNSGDFADCELIWTSLKTAVRLYKYRWNGMLQEDMKNKEQRFHPTQKPVGLFVNIFEKYQFQTCLDPFLGSGTTLIACEKTNRRGFGMEIDRGYCQTSVQRWVDFTEQDIIKINGQTVSWGDYIDV